MAKIDFTFVGTPHDPYSISGSDPWNANGSARLAAWYNCDKGHIVLGGPNRTGQTNDDRGYRVDKLKDLSGNSKLGTGNERHLYRMNENAPVVTGSDVTISNDPQLVLKGDDLRYLMGSENNDSAWAFGMATFDKDYDIDDGASDADMRERNHWVSASKNDNGTFMDDRYNLLQSDRGGNGYTLFGTGKQHSYEEHDADWEYASLNLMAYPYGLSRGSAHGDFRQTHGTFQMYLENDLQSGGHNEHRVGVMWATRTGGTGYEDGRNSMVHNSQMAGTSQEDTGTETSTFIRSNKIYECARFHPCAMRYDSTGLTTEGTGSYNIELFVNGHTVMNQSESWNHGHAPRMDDGGVGLQIGHVGGARDGYISMSGYQATHQSMTNPENSHAWLEGCVFDDALSNIRMQQIQKYFAERIGSVMSGSDGGSGLQYLSQFDGGGEGLQVARTSLTGSNAFAPLSNAIGATYHRQFFQKQTASVDPPLPVIQYETAGGAFVKSTKSSAEFYRVPSTKAISLRAWVRLSGHQHDANNDGVQFALIGKATSQFGHKLDNIKGYAFKFGTLEDGTKDGAAPKFRLSLRNSDQWEDGDAGGLCNDTEVTNASITPDVDTWFKMRLDIIPSTHAFDLIKAYVLDNSDGTTWRQMGTTITIESGDIRYRPWCDNTLELRRQSTPSGIHNGYWTAMKTTNGKQLVHTKVYLEGFQILTDTV